MNKFQPLEDRVLILPIKKTDEEKTSGGLYIPSTVEKEVSEGEVVSVGQGRYAPENGAFIENVLRVGDLVLFGSTQGMPLTLDGQELKLMREGDVLLYIGRKQDPII
jgi:chaperonin GroES